MGLGLGEQCVGLGLERLHGVCAGSEASWRLLERNELHEGVGELEGSPSESVVRLSKLHPGAQIHFFLFLPQPEKPTVAANGHGRRTVRRIQHIPPPGWIRQAFIGLQYKSQRVPAQ